MAKKWSTSAGSSVSNSNFCLRRGYKIRWAYRAPLGDLSSSTVGSVFDGFGTVVDLAVRIHGSVFKAVIKRLKTYPKVDVSLLKSPFLGKTSILTGISY
jgi:hypothetical protein